MITLIDTHAHIADACFKKYISELITRCYDNGISHVIVMGVDEKSSRSAIKLAEKYPNILRVCVGFQPQEKPYPKSLAFIDELIKHPLVCGIGEIGIDLYYDDNEPLDKQVNLFEKQVQLACKYNLPMSIHARSAIKEVVSVLKKYPDAYGVLHCFTETKKDADLILTLPNFYFGIGGVLTYKNAHNLREVVTTIPLEKIVLETDAPYLAPQIVRGKTNEPAYLIHTARTLAELKSVSYEMVCKVTSDNAKMIFKI